MTSKNCFNENGNNETKKETKTCNISVSVY